ncbi:MAG: hypothetical protein MK209_09645 [Planctomycetes bacterium]|nr:hypothetical protein [Planctomycetota bacterium]
MDLENLLWIDWIGMALVAYGLVAGGVRGLTQQFSRSAVWVVAVLAAGAGSGALAWLASLFVEEGASQVQFEAWLQLAVVLLSVLALGAVRLWIFGSSGAARTLADALLGAVSGVLYAAIAWLLLWGVALQARGHAELVEEATSAEWAEVISRGPAALPDFLSLPLLEGPSPQG